MKKSAIVLLLSALVLPVSAQEKIRLISEKAPISGWSFDNGQEFKGATGSLTADDSEKHQGNPSIHLQGDFTKGGGYVQAGLSFKPTDIAELSFWVKNPGAENFTLRLIDGSGQCHQLKILTDSSDEWQHINFPLQKFFANLGTSNAVQGVSQYQSWSGAKDGKWHGPGKALYILLPKDAEPGIRDLWLNDVTITTPVPEAPVTLVPTTTHLIGGDAGRNWTFSNGQEFKGATGSLDWKSDAMLLSGDFTKGGAYVAALSRLPGLNLEKVSTFHISYQTSNAAVIGIQLTDSTGQTHQRRLEINADSKPQILEVVPEKIAGGEHWGGANDGKWHNPPKAISIALNKASDTEKDLPSVLITSLAAEGVMAVRPTPDAFSENFSIPASLATWKIEGAAIIADGRLLLSRSENDASKPTSATSPTFSASAGNWLVSFTHIAALTSPDNSFSATLVLQALDSSGKILENFTLADIYGKKPALKITVTRTLPTGTTSARIIARLNKTWGEFRLDDLSAAFLAPAKASSNPVSGILFSTAELGNLLFPDSSRKIEITVLANKPLPENQRDLTIIVRDYWGTEQLPVSKLTLAPAQTKDGKTTHNATLDLSAAPLKTGTYYEIEATSAAPGMEPFSHQTSLAILPKAPTHAFAPGEIPFTARNWDNRIPEYIRLTNRLGVRICGIWAGWSSKAPYKAHAPGLDLAKELNMGWLITTPAVQIELGKRDYSETALREGVKNLITEFGDYRPMIINLGNEPHGTGRIVEDNVAAYKAIYESIKATDPTIPVVATSVEPNEEYFKNGYGKYCDAFDFHIYEAPKNVRNSIKKYRVLQEKYDCVKPIWSTELGLNSQGQTRLVVANQVYRKAAAFFAEGGANFSWFGLLYPDKDGKSHGSSGDSHNIFDCRFNRYAPRLDAIAYYNTVNCIADKKFVAEQIYADGTHTTLFRNAKNQSLQILWNDKGWADISLPLAAAGEIRVTFIDGTIHTLQADENGTTISIGADPILITYTSTATLPENLEPSITTWTSVPENISAKEKTIIRYATPHGTFAQPKLPPGWGAASDKSGTVHLIPPPSTDAREIPITLVLTREGKPIGLLHRRCLIAD